MKIHLFVLIVNFSNMVSNLNFDLQPLYLQGITEEVGGDEGDRTPYLNAASVVLYQMSYVPIYSKFEIQILQLKKLQFKKNNLAKYYQRMEAWNEKIFLMASPRGVEPLLPP